MTERLRSYHLARFALLLVNLVGIAYIAWIILSTTDLICLNDNARDMLERLRAVPVQPHRALSLSVSLYLLLLLSVFIRESLGPKLTLVAALIFSVFDLVICVIILGVLDFGIKYLLLVPIANAIAYIPDKIWKTAFAALVVLFYIPLDYQLVSVGFPVFSIDDYVMYHPALERAYLLGFRNILISVGEVLFITFLVLEVQNLLDESIRIKKLNRELTESRDKLAVANVQLQIYSEQAEETAKIRERNRLAREIHDTIGHCLTGISLGLAAARELIRSAPDMLGTQLERLDELSRRGLEDVRRSLKELRPDMLERNILSDALTKLADEINNCSNRTVELRISAPMDNLNPSLQETVYRIVQESITNSVRHGNAQRIIISIDSENGALFLRIKDDGIGCSKVSEGFGLHYMRERILEKDGFVEIETQPGKGFEISAYIPNAGDRSHD